MFNYTTARARVSNYAEDTVLIDDVSSNVDPMESTMNETMEHDDDYYSTYVSLLPSLPAETDDEDECIQIALQDSLQMQQNEAETR